MTASWTSANSCLVPLALDANGVAQVFVARRHGGVDPEPAWRPFSADFKTLDLRTAPRLALPGRRDPPVCLAFCGVRLTPSIRVNRSSTLMPLTTVGLAVLDCATMKGFLWLGGGMGSSRVIAAWRAPTGCAGPGFR